MNPISSKKFALIASIAVAIFSFIIYYRPYLWLGILLAIGSGIITFIIMRSGKVQRYRRSIVIYYALVTWIGTLVIFSFIGLISLLKWVSGHLRVYYYGGMPVVGTALVPCNFNLPSVSAGISLWGTETGIKAIGGLPVVWPTSVFYFFLLVLFPYLVTAFVLGRGFCGWICYFGGTVEVFQTSKNPRWTLSRFRKKYQEPGKNNTAVDGLREDVKDIKYGVAIGLILLAIGLVIPVICIVCWTWLIQYLWLGIGAVIVFTLFIIILPFMTGKRTWCAILCPVGALLNFIERITPFNVRIDPNKCTKNYSCVTVCPMYALTRQTINEIYAPNVDCIKCGTCIDHCPEKAINLYLL